MGHFMRLYIIRHGEVELNVKKLLNGRNDSELTAKGIADTEKMKANIRNLKLDQIICSPLKRAKQTCEIINENKVPVYYDNRLLERDTGHLMYQSDTCVDAKVFYDPSKKLIYDDCEGFGSILDRVNSFLCEIKEKYPNQSILIVTHLDTCRAFYSAINHISDASKIESFHQNNSELVLYNI